MTSDQVGLLGQVDQLDRVGLLGQVDQLDQVGRVGRRTPLHPTPHEWQRRDMDVLPEVVVGPRLTLRRWRRDDVALLRDAVTANLEHLRPWMPWIAVEPMSDGDRLDLVDRWEAEWRDGGDVVLGAFLDATVIGSCGLHRRRGPGTLEIGYWVHVDHVRQGYATEIARVLTAAALALPGITRVEIHHDRANVASRRVPELLGYRLDGESADEPAAPGEVGIDVCWSTTAETWSPPPTPTEHGT